MTAAAAMAALQIIRLYGTYAWAEFGYMALTCLSWIFIFFSLKHVHAKKVSIPAGVRTAPLCGIIFCILESLSAVIAVHNAGRASESAFSDIRVMAFAYLSLIASFYIYHGMLKTLRQAAMRSEWAIENRVPGSFGNGWGIFIIVILTLTAVPSAGLFAAGQTAFILTAAAAGIGFLAQFFMCVRIIQYAKILSA